jgi:hypothetical protein
LKERKKQVAFKRCQKLELFYNKDQQKTTEKKMSSSIIFTDACPSYRCVFASLSSVLSPRLITVQVPSLEPWDVLPLLSFPVRLLPFS